MFQRTLRFFLLFVLIHSITPLITVAQGWIFTFTVTSSGPCGTSLPSIPTFTVPYMPNQSFCESLRQQILAISAGYPVYNDQNQYIGDCTVYYTCTPCTGSDMVIPGDNTFNPGNVSIDGIVQGNAFFTPHESKAIQNWIEDYILRQNSLGMNFPGSAIDAFPDIPATGDADFDKYYADQSIHFEKPEQGGVVDLTGKEGVIDLLGKQETPVASKKEEDKTVVPVMGSAPLTVEEIERLNAYNLKQSVDNRLDDSNFAYEPAAFWNTPEMIKLGTDALKFTVGFISGGYEALIVVDVASGIINGKSGQEIMYDVAGDVMMKGLGDVAGAVIGKGGTSIGNIKLTTGSLSGSSAKQDFEMLYDRGKDLTENPWDSVNNQKKQ